MITTTVLWCDEEVILLTLKLFCRIDIKSDLFLNYYYYDKFGRIFILNRSIKRLLRSNGPDGLGYLCPPVGWKTEDQKNLINNFCFEWSNLSADGNRSKF